MFLSLPKKLSISLACGFLLFSLYSFFSYGLTAPNLVLLNNQVFWRFQTWIWETLFNDREFLYYLFIGGGALLFSWYALTASIVKALPKKISWRMILGSLVIALPLLFASNALSYDVFNYIFNAKMVLTYKVNPHTTTAEQFSYDPWTRFMHNVHTPAPYGKGWTVLSLIPHSLAGDSFIINWFAFRLMSVASFGGLIATWWWLDTKTQWSVDRKTTVLVLLNPLLLIEVVGNMHNDLWMMVPAMFSLGLMMKKNTKITSMGLSLVLLFVSISIKLATVALIPLWLLLLLHTVGIKNRLSSFAHAYWPLWASILLFLPLITERSKWFLPWYLSWSLVWLPLIIPLITKKISKISPPFSVIQKILPECIIIWTCWLMSLTISSWFRYAPFLQANSYDDAIITQQRIITWLGGIISTIIIYSTYHWWFKQK